MTNMLERFRHTRVTDPNYDQYEEVMGERLTVEALLDIREMEDMLIDLGHITEADRYPLPPHLLEAWTQATGPGESLRTWYVYEE